MSEEDRMDRARRLRERRERRRAEGGDEEVDDAAVDDVAADAATDEPPDSADEAESTARSTPDVAEAVAGVDAAPAPMPSAEELEASLGDVAAAAGAPDADAAEDIGRVAAHAGNDESTRVLEFSLGDERYCIDIDYVEEIVTDTTVTRVPNTPAYVAGVVDLRGQLTTILDPTVLLDIEDGVRGELLVVFDGDAVDEGGHLGWAVDDVRQVAPVTDAQVTDAPVEDASVIGVVDREDDDAMVVWTSPELALEEAKDDESTPKEPH